MSWHLLVWTLRPASLLPYHTVMDVVSASALLFVPGARNISNGISTSEIAPQFSP